MTVSEILVAQSDVLPAVWDGLPARGSRGQDDDDPVQRRRPGLPPRAIGVPRQQPGERHEPTTPTRQGVFMPSLSPGAIAVGHTPMVGPVFKTSCLLWPRAHT